MEIIKSSASKDGETKQKAREIVRFLVNNENLYKVDIVTNDHYDILKEFNLPVNSDNLILVSCLQVSKYTDIEFISFDLLCRSIATNILRLKVYNWINETDEYIGYKDMAMSNEEMAYFYEHMSVNKYGLLINEYIIVRNINNDIIDKLKWNGTAFQQINYKKINNIYSGKVKPRNVLQELSFDLLQDNRIKVKLLTGKQGVGKDFMMVSNALQLVKDGIYEKIMWVRNNIEVRHTKEIGFLPGSKNLKLLPFAMPMADHLGNQYGLEMLMSSGEIELEHLGHIRGRDLKNTIIMCSESENMTKEHIQLLLGRVAEGTSLWINGDLKQIDDKVFENNSGIVTLIDKLRGNKNFGFVKLYKNERSEVSNLADLLD